MDCSSTMRCCHCGKMPLDFLCSHPSFSVVITADATPVPLTSPSSCESQNGKNITRERKKNKMNSKYFFFSNCSSGWNNSHNKQQSLYRLIINKQLSWKRNRLSLQLQEFSFLKPTLVSSTSVSRRSPRNSNPNSDWSFPRLDVYILLLT